MSMQETKQQKTKLMCVECKHPRSWKERHTQHQVDGVMRCLGCDVCFEVVLKAAVEELEQYMTWVLGGEPPRRPGTPNAKCGCGKCAVKSRLENHLDVSRHPVWHGLPPEVPFSSLGESPLGAANRVVQESGRGVRSFDTGATRSPDHTRHDPEGFLSPLVIDRFNEYMHKHREQSDGTTRDSDNWQRGMPLTSYVKGMWRHFLHFWTRHRGWTVTDPGAAANIEEDLCAIIFNAQGYLHTLVAERKSMVPLTKDRNVRND